MFTFPLQENNVGRLKPGNWEGFWCLLCLYSELRVPARAALVFLSPCTLVQLPAFCSSPFPRGCTLSFSFFCLWFLYLSSPCFRICSVLRFSLLFSHLILIRAFQRRWLSPCLPYRLGAEEVRGLVSSVERLQVALLEFKPGSLELPSAETSSDFRIWTQNSPRAQPSASSS